MEADVLRELQMTAFGILSDVAKICDENDITYYLLGGTLLGAVRHKGFIPWDDDLDIGMPREDYNRFLTLCREKNILGSKYYLHHITTDNKYWLPFAKVRKNNTIFAEDSIKRIQTHKGIFIDVFPLDYVDVNSGFFYMNKARCLRFLHHFAQSKGSKAVEKSFIRRVVKWITYIVPTSTMLKLWDRWAGSKKEGKYIINYGSNYKVHKQTMLREIYEPACKVEFEGKLFSAPGKPEEYLKHLFGNWQKLPPVEERTNHNPSVVIFDTEK